MIHELCNKIYFVSVGGMSAISMTWAMLDISPNGFPTAEGSAGKKGRLTNLAPAKNYGGETPLFINWPICMQRARAVFGRFRCVRKYTHNTSPESAAGFHQTLYMMFKTLKCFSPKLCNRPSPNLHWGEKLAFSPDAIYKVFLFLNLNISIVWMWMETFLANTLCVCNALKYRTRLRRFGLRSFAI